MSLAATRLSMKFVIPGCGIEDALENFARRIVEEEEEESCDAPRNMGKKWSFPSSKSISKKISKDDNSSVSTVSPICIH